MLKVNSMNHVISMKKQYGAGLIETMVSLLILGVGLLGVLSLQANGTSSNQRAIFATEAQVLAQDMADRIRSFGSDGLGDRGERYDNTEIGPRGGDPSYTAVTSCASGCIPSDVVSFDQHEWEAALEETSLPRGTAKVILANNDSDLNQYIIRVSWDQDRTGAREPIDDDETCLKYANQKDTYLTCYDLVVSLYRDD